MGDRDWPYFGHHKAYGNGKNLVAKPMAFENFQSLSL
jgi:hypothetical protein